MATKYRGSRQKQEKAISLLESVGDWEIFPLGEGVDADGRQYVDVAFGGESPLLGPMYVHPTKEQMDGFTNAGAVAHVRAATNDPPYPPCARLYADENREIFGDHRVR